MKKYFLISVLLFLFSPAILAAPGVALPLKKTQYFGDEFAEILFPSSPIVTELFSDFINLDLLRLTTSAPKGRKISTPFFSGFIEGDLLHQQGIQILINRGEISKKTLIISNTGHDIPMAAQLIKNKYFTTQVVFHLPEKMNDPGNYERIVAQAQDWGQLLKTVHDNSENKTPDIIFLGVEGHRKEYNNNFLYKLDTSLLPSREELLSIGIEKVVYIFEKHPNTAQEDVKKTVYDDIRPYLKGLNLPISYLGADCRRKNGCGWKPICYIGDPACGWKESYGYLGPK